MNKKLLFLFLIFYIVGTVFSQVAPNNKNVAPNALTKKIEVVMGLGSDVIKLDFATYPKYIEITNEPILKYTFIPSRREITFIGKKPGTTSVRIRDLVGDIRAVFEIKIVANDKSKSVGQLKEYLGDIEGLEIGVKGDRVYIGGFIVVPTDIGIVAKVLSDPRFSGVLVLVELSPHTQRVIARKMQDELHNNGLKNVSVRVVNNRFWLEGVVGSIPEKTRAERVAMAYLPDKLETLAKSSTSRYQKAELNMLQNFLKVDEKPEKKPLPKIIKITSQFVELTKDYSKVFGFQWNPLMGDNGGEIRFGKTNRGDVTSSSNGTLSGIITNLFPKLHSAKSAGHARIIQSGVILVNEKEKGSIQKTGNKNLVIGGGENPKVAVAKSGLTIGITPEILEGEQVQLDVEIEVDSTSGEGESTEQLVDKIKTKVVVKAKESAVIGGVSVKRNVVDYDKDSPPGSTSSQNVQNGSPLFTFLRSKAHITNRSQFVIFVTPEIVESASIGTEDIKKKFRQRRR